MRRWWSFALLAMTVALVHGRDVTFGWTSLDDLTLVVDDHAFLAAPGAWWRAFGRTYFFVVDAAHVYYRPIVTASYALDAHAYGTAAAGYHATNVALFMVATCLVFALLERALIPRPVALLVALTFAVHPALAPAVAWVPGRNDSLLVGFALLALLTYARGGWAGRTGYVAAFALAMFTKETAIVVPVVCLAWTAWVEPRREPPARVLSLFTWAASIAIVVGFALARGRALRARGASVPALDWDGAIHHAGALVSSAGKLLFPVSHAPIATLDDAPMGLGVGALALSALLVWAVRRRATPRLRVVAFGAALYVLSLVPSFFGGGSLALENRLVLPAVGALFVVAELASALAIDRRALAAFGGPIVMVLGIMTLGYASDYRDPLSFGRAAVAGAPRSSLAHFTLGQARQRRGELDAALGEYAAALALDPAEPIVNNNVAVIHMHRGEWADAERALAAELRVNPGYAIAEENLKVVRRHLGP